MANNKDNKKSPIKDTKKSPIKDTKKSPESNKILPSILTKPITDITGKKKSSDNEANPITQPSNKKESDKPCCSICKEEEETTDKLMRPCNCSGTVAYYHYECLKSWIETRGFDECQLCKQKYKGIILTKKKQNICYWIHSEGLYKAAVVLLIVFAFLFYISYLGWIHAMLADGFGYKTSGYIIMIIGCILCTVTILLLILLLTACFVNFKHWQEDHFKIVVTAQDSKYTKNT